MIKIEKGNSVLTVTAGAYENYYKHLGYKPVGVPVSCENSGEGNTYPPDDSQHLDDPTQLRIDGSDSDDGEEPLEDDEDEELNLSEIPLSEMNFDQLCEYADELGLDHGGIRSKKEMRALIRAHLT